MPSGKTYIKIASQTLSAGATTISFTNIPQNYTDLILVADCRYTSSTNWYLRLNNSSTSLYSKVSMYAYGSSASSAINSNQTESYINVANGSSSDPNNFVISFQNYSNTNIFKTYLIRENMPTQAVSATNGLWRSTAPITQIDLTLYQSSTSGATFNLYGIEAASSFVPNAKASGGDSIVSDGSYIYHVFRNSGKFSPYQSLTADILQVAGGGAGGSSSADRRSGGGGAGGLLYSSAQSLTVQAYTVTVGAGGSAVVGSEGSNGNNSQFGSSTASVGGGGGAGNGSTINGLSGGSGGGGSSGISGSGSGSTGGSPTSGQGNSGGGGGISGYSWGGGGGGGGAGSAGTAGTTYATSGDTGTGGAGGNGINTYSSWATVTGTGVSGYYAGGGGGNGGVGGAGGLGGGGYASTGLTRGVFGSPATGGGGGAGASGSSTNIGGNGGSGIIIVRYAV